MKKFLQSRTIKVGILSVVIGTLVFIQGEVNAGIALDFMGIVMVILRLVTKEGIIEMEN